MGLGVPGFDGFPGFNTAFTFQDNRSKNAQLSAKRAKSREDLETPLSLGSLAPYHSPSIYPMATLEGTDGMLGTPTPWRSIPPSSKLPRTPVPETPTPQSQVLQNVCRCSTCVESQSLKSLCITQRTQQPQPLDRISRSSYLVSIMTTLLQSPILERSVNITRCLPNNWVMPAALTRALSSRVYQWLLYLTGLLATSLLLPLGYRLLYQYPS